MTEPVPGSILLSIGFEFRCSFPCSATWQTLAGGTPALALFAYCLSSAPGLYAGKSVALLGS